MKTKGNAAAFIELHSRPMRTGHTRVEMAGLFSLFVFNVQELF
jgi:hypothetical protein